MGVRTITGAHSGRDPTCVSMVLWDYGWGDKSNRGLGSLGIAWSARWLGEIACGTSGWFGFRNLGREGGVRVGRARLPPEGGVQGESESVAGIAEVVEDLGGALDEGEQADGVAHGFEMACGSWVSGPGDAVRREKPAGGFLA